MQDGGIQDGCIELKMAISQFRLNLESVCVRFYGSIHLIESVKLPLVNYLERIQVGDIHDGGIQNGVLLLSCVEAPLCPRCHIRPLYWKATEVIVDTTSNPLSWW